MCMVTSGHLDRMAAGGWDSPPEGHKGAVAGSSAGREEATVATGTAPKFVPWHFEQNLHEAVFVPAGCPHQV